MGGRLAEGRRYCYSNKVKYAHYLYATHTIEFNEKWVGQFFDPKVKAAVFAHEIWHSVTEEKAKKALRQISNASRALVLGLVILDLIALIGYFLIRNFPGLISIGVLSLALILVYVCLRLRWSLMKKYQWPLESESDAAAAKCIGSDALIEALRTFPRDDCAHPPTRIRIQRLNELKAEYPKSAIDFDQLERDVKQEFVMMKN
jgi:hypothetical protein